MRVAFLINELPGAPEAFLLDQIAGLLDLGCDVEIFPVRETPCADARLLPRTHFPRTPSTYFVRPLAAAGIILREARSGRVRAHAFNVFRHGRHAASLRLFFESVAFGARPAFDAVHCHAASNSLRGAEFREIGLIGPSTRLVMSFYGNDTATQRLFSAGDLFLCVSEHMRFRLLALGAPAERTQVHRLGVPTDLFIRSGKPPERNARLRVVSVAPLVGQEGIEYGIRALAVLKQEVPGLIRYEVFGEGPMRPRLEKLIRSLELEGTVVLAGEQNRASVAQALARADVLLAPGAGDTGGAPSVLLEAMSSGAAVVATRNHGAPELVHDGITGILVQERDVKSIAAALATLCREPGLIESMGDAGRRAALHSHDLLALNRALLEHYVGK